MEAFLHKPVKTVNVILLCQFFFFLGVLNGSIYPIVALRADAATVYPYPYSEYEPGQWIDETHQFNTYETLCKGYYILDISNKNKTKYVGFGDLDFKYTYELPYNNYISSTTVPLP